MLTLTVPMEFQQRLESDPTLKEKMAETYRQLFALEPEVVYGSAVRRHLVAVFDLADCAPLQPVLQQIWSLYRVYPTVEPVLDRAAFAAMKNQVRGIALD